MVPPPPQPFVIFLAPSEFKPRILATQNQVRIILYTRTYVFCLYARENFQVENSTEMLQQQRIMMSASEQVAREVAKQ